MPPSESGLSAAATTENFSLFLETNRVGIGPTPMIDCSLNPRRRDFSYPAEPGANVAGLGATASWVVPRVGRARHSDCGRSPLTVSRFLLALFFAVVGSASAADAPLSPTEFTRDFVQTLRTSAPTYTIKTPRDLQVTVQKPEELESSVFLYNAYNEYLRSPSNGDRIIRKYFAGLVNPKDEVRKVDAARVVPVLKTRAWLSEVRIAAQAKGAASVPDIVSDEFNDQLMIVYAEDNPNTLRYLLPEQVENLNIKREDLRALAVANLRTILTKIDVRPGLLVTSVRSGGNYESGLLLIDDFWSSDRIKVDGEIVVAIPSRDRLLVTGSKNAAGIAKLRQLATRAVAETSQHLTDTLFVYRDGRFEVFKD